MVKLQKVKTVQKDYLQYRLFPRNTTITVAGFLQ